MGTFKQFLSGGFRQTKDNNESFENQLENEFLTEDFEKRFDYFAKKNLPHTLNLIEKYVLVKKLKEDNILLPTKKELQKLTFEAFWVWKEEKYIDDLNVIRKDFLKIIEKEIEEFNKL